MPAVAVLIVGHDATPGRITHPKGFQLRVADLLTRFTLERPTNVGGPPPPPQRK